ncbi:MAG: Crp/Fnr family transcriptional regulator [Gammaproteobacteria bacterium]|nr:Crp/Fnr family transcriptional regulator [Gammaproteobacteria bacterium]
MSNRADLIKAIPLLSELEPQQLQVMIDTSIRKELAAEQQLFQHGSDARYFYLVEEGSVKLSRLAPNGQEKVIEILRQGHTFAEAVMFFDKPLYPVDATALEDTVVIGLDGHRFMDILRESPETALRLMGTLSMRLHRRVNEIDSLSLQNSTLRVINFLLQNLPDEEADEAIIELETTKKLIAARLSIQPETFSRALNQLQKKGAIHVEGKTIEILDVDLLHDLAIDL